MELPFQYTIRPTFRQLHINPQKKVKNTQRETQSWPQGQFKRFKSADLHTQSHTHTHSQTDTNQIDRLVFATRVLPPCVPAMAFVRSLGDGFMQIVCCSYALKLTKYRRCNSSMFNVSSQSWSNIVWSLWEQIIRSCAFLGPFGISGVLAALLAVDLGFVARSPGGAAVTRMVCVRREKCEEDDDDKQRRARRRRRWTDDDDDDDDGTDDYGDDYDGNDCGGDDDDGDDGGDDGDGDGDDDDAFAAFADDDVFENKHALKCPQIIPIITQSGTCHSGGAAPRNGRWKRRLCGRGGGVECCWTMYCMDDAGVAWVLNLWHYGLWFFAGF